MKYKIKKILEAIYDFPYNLRNFIKRLIDYTPILWHDRDWDYAYILYLLRKKLERMEKRFRKFRITTNWKKIADEIHLAILLINRITEDDYLSLLHTKHKDKWGEFKMLDENDPLYDIIGHSITTSKVSTEEEDKQQSKELMSIYYKEDYLRNQDWNMLFNLFNKRMGGWWD